MVLRVRVSFILNNGVSRGEDDCVDGGRVSREDICVVGGPPFARAPVIIIVVNDS